MIRPLRIIHRRVFYVLAISLTLLVAVALIARRPEAPAITPAATHAPEVPVGGTP